jgi:hypothetical protein
VSADTQAGDPWYSNLLRVELTSCGGWNERSISCRLTEILSVEASPSEIKSEKPMFARLVTMQLRPSFANEFPVVFEKEIVPLLKKQEGFVDELLLVAPKTRKMVAISLWETKGYAEVYNGELYPRVEKMVERFIEGVPDIQGFDEKYATFHKIAIPATP